MSKLNKVRRGVQHMPLRVMVHGRGGIGKTTLAADAPRAIFLDLNHGSDLVDCARYPISDEPTFPELLAAVRDIRQNGTTEYQTLVIDTMGEVERAIWQHVIDETNKRAKAKAANIEDVGGGFHKGYQIALKYHAELADELERVRAAGLNVILIAHSDLTTRKNPAGLDWQQYAPNLHKNAAEFWIGWCDLVLFLAFEEGATATDGRATKGQGWSTGRRLIHSREDATFRAKYRLPLESPVELPATRPWSLIAEAHQALVNPLTTWTREQLVAGCRAELVRIDNQAITDKFEQTLDDMTDEKLRQGLQSLRKR